MKRIIFISLLIYPFLSSAQTKVKNERTSKKVASTAGRVLRDPNSTKKEKSLAGSALTQTRNRGERKKKY